MQAGKLDRRITIERSIETKDALGGIVYQWLPFKTVWAAALPISDGERWRAQEVAADVTTRFQIRWGAGVTAKDWIVYEGRSYDVKGVKEIARREGQEITAAARAEERATRPTHEPIIRIHGNAKSRAMIRWVRVIFIGCLSCLDAEGDRHGAQHRQDRRAPRA